MALIKCPECGKQISDKAAACPHCGLPSIHFAVDPPLTQRAAGAGVENLNPAELRHALISFERDYEKLFSRLQYIDSKRLSQFTAAYGKYHDLLGNRLILQYLKTNATTLRIEQAALNRFLDKIQHLTSDVKQHNSSFVDRRVNEYHLYKAALDYETLKSGLGEYIQKVAHRRSKSIRTITGEFLRSLQEIQIANFLYLNGIDYVYEKPYPAPMPGSRKKYTPDFFIFQGESEAYIEHYALTDTWRTPSITLSARSFRSSAIKAAFFSWGDTILTKPSSHYLTSSKKGTMTVLSVRNIPVPTSHI